MSRQRPVLYFLFVAIVTFLHATTATFAADIAVAVEGKSTPEVCAEKDNIEINFSSPVVRKFRIEAVHPAYIGMIARDRYLPDYTSCNMPRGEEFAAGAQRVTFFETPRFWLVGYRMPEFWRPGSVPVRVGTRVEQGFHLIQFWMRYRERAEEVLVFYPPDGYWRMRPLPPGDLRWTAYGSSFLVGPVETVDRPIVVLDEVAFDPDKRSFTLKLRRGGAARLSFAAVDEDHFALDVAFEGDLPRNLPFTSLRSMYATIENADASRIAWRDLKSQGWSEAPIMDFKSATASEVWLGRHVASRHNLSAPDLIVNRFADPAAP